MPVKPIMCSTHPRACSTAFERVFMTRHGTLKCGHEPFGDAYYYGPERLANRYDDDEKNRLDSGFSDYTYKTALDQIHEDNSEGKRLFLKDMAQYLIPPFGRPSSIAPSLQTIKRGVGTDKSAAEPGNPTVMPEELLKQFHFTFLIRHPRSSVPSYYRCCVPPLSEMTGFAYFDPSEAGYSELRMLFDYLKQAGHIGPAVAGGASGTKSNEVNGTNGLDGSYETNGVNEVNGINSTVRPEICVIDADYLLDNPPGVIEAYCNSVGIDYHPDMLSWDNEEDQKHASKAFAKWKGFHEDVLDSCGLNGRTHPKKRRTDEECYDDWAAKYGEEGAKIVKDTVDANMADYEYLKQYAVRV